MAGQVLAEDDLDQWIREPDAPKPLDMPLGPGRAGPIPHQAPAQQQLADAMPASHQITPQILPGANQIAKRLKPTIGHQHRPQLTSRVQTRKLQRITRIGLDPIARLARDRARRTDHHLDPHRPRRPRQPKPGRTRLIHRPDRPRQRLQPLDRRHRRTVELHPEHLTRPQLHRCPSRPAGMNIKPNETDTFRHVDAPLPSMR
jgi:hypothetical protein